LKFLGFFLKIAIKDLSQTDAKDIKKPGHSPGTYVSSPSI